MSNAYGLYPWIWSDSEQAHVPPLGAGAVLDLRPEAEQAKASQSSGWGLFAWPDQVYDEQGQLVANMNAMPLDAISLGYGDCREIQPNTATRDELRTRLGLSAQPAGATLIDCVSDVLGSLADPTGVSGPKPLLPTREGLLEIHLAYQSRVRAEAFNGAALFANTATGRNNRIREVLRTDLETAYASGGAELLAKVLGGWCDRWGISYSQAAKWRNLIRGPMLARLLDEGKGKFSPKKPRTSYSDDFSGTLSAWTTVAGSWLITSGALVCGTSGVQTIRYESDVSSSDHWVTLTQLSAGSASTRPFGAVRFSSAANTCYTGNGTSGGFTLAKIIAGTPTTLSTTVSGTAIDTCETRAAGSTISITRVSGADTSLTDTAITGNLRGGVGESYAAGAATPVDAWSIDDGITAGGGPSLLLLLGVG